MNFLKIAVRDISSIVKNRFIRVSVVAIIIVPLLYSLLYLDAFWDPYSRLKNMPVAVVNCDNGGVKDGKQTNYGNEIIENLKKNDKLGWRFVSKEDADSGVKGSKYYAEFVIPEDFTKKLLDSETGKPQQPTILYTANEKRNFLAAQINNKAQLELKDEIEKKITKESTKVAFDKLYEIKDSLHKAADGSKELRDNLYTAKDGSEKLKNGISEAKDGVDKASKGLSDNKALLSLLNTNNTPKLKTIMNDANTLSNADTSTLGLVTNFATKNNIAMIKKTALDYKAIGLPELMQSPLFTALPTLTSAENIKNTSKLLQDADQLSKVDTKKLQPLIGMLQNSDKLNKLLSDAQGLTNVDVKAMSQMMSSQKESAAQFIDASSKLNTDANTTALMTAINTNGNLNDIQKKQLVGLVQGYNKLTTQTAQNLAGSAKALDSAEGSIAALAQVQQELKDNKVLIDGVQTALSPENVKYLSSVLPQLMSMQQDLQNNQNSLAAVKQLLMQANDPSTKASLAKIAVLQSDLQKAQPVINAFNAQLTPENINKLDKTPALVSQLLKMQKDLKNNEQILQVASNALTDKNVTMANNLINALPQLTDGVNKLYDGSVQLNDGMVKLADGSGELYDKLQDGADKLDKNLVNSSEEMGTFISAPVAVNEKPINPVKDYGTGFTPYFISLSLWVGAIMMFFIITDKVDDDIKANSASIVAGKFLSYGFIGILQSVLVSVVVLALGLKPNNVPLFILFNVLMSFVFIAIIQSLIFLLGQAGRLLSIALLILQLTSCAGTFPLELTPKFFKILNPFMPFTYCVSALREIISGSNYAVIAQSAGVLASAMVVFLMISMVMKGRADKLQEMVLEKKNDSFAA